MLRPLGRQVGQTHRLLVFDAVVRAGSFTGAAADLGVSQPAVSRQVALLEDELGVELFDRDQNRAVPTVVGAELAEHVDAGFRSIEEGLAAVLGRDDILTLAVQPPIAEAWFSPRLDEVREAMAPATLQLVIFEQEEELALYEHDVVIRFSAGRHRGHRSVLLIPERVRPLASPLYAARHRLDKTTPPTTLTDLQLLEVSTASTWMRWQDWFAAHGIEWRSGPQVIGYRNYASLLQLALGGHGVVLGWRSLLGDLLSRGLLVEVGPEVVRPDVGYRLVWPTSLGRRESLRRLRSWLVPTVAQLATIDPVLAAARDDEMRGPGPGQ